MTTESQNLSIVTTTSAIGEHWEVQYGRYFNRPSPHSSSPLHPSLVPLRKGEKGTWISSFSSLAHLNLLTADYHSHSFRSVILTVTLLGNVIEEHYISKLHFTWPQVSCMSGYPPRGSKVVFMSYKDQDGQNQKFVVRFFSIDETERFINLMKEMFGHDTIDGSMSGISKSKTSYQSEFIPRSIQDWDPITSSANYSQDAYRPIQDWSPSMSSVDTYIQPMHQSENHNASESSNSLGTTLSQDVQKLSAFPPSFTSLLMNCYPVTEHATQPTFPEEVTLKNEIMKYLNDSSFQDMLSKVQKVVSEFEDDLLMM
uniref:protein POOR HOMOLOGOUS SYNAPSIS 1 n=1 Tax=Erigeron canadensis TaxID=72917 RepID=UPI001CB96AD2|nr:protein POOR HOMOLOGOUS SYNAPSIS 1 [Erigeron canadensis]